MAEDSFEFRHFLLEVSNQLTVSDRTNLEFLVKAIIPAGKIEHLRETPIRLFEELQQRGRIGPDNLEFLRKLLEYIGRQDLVGEVEIFERPCRPRLTVKTEQFLQVSGYCLRINGGEHMVSDEGDEYVNLRSGQRYGLIISNFNNERCICEVKIDGHVIFTGLVINPGEKVLLERPCHTASHFTFFAVVDAPSDSGIDERNVENNGRIQVTFTPEVAKMKITYDVGYGNFYSMTCLVNMTDVEFHQHLSLQFRCDAATVFIDSTCKPLGKRNVKLIDYGIKDGSHFRINLGLIGGVVIPESVSKSPEFIKTHELIPWIPGASTLQGQSEQTVTNISDIAVPNDEMRKVVLQLRFVTRADENPLPSNGKCIPFVLGNRIPPPV